MASLLPKYTCAFLGIIMLIGVNKLYAQDTIKLSEPTNTFGYSLQGSLGIAVANTNQVQESVWNHLFGYSLAVSATINYYHADRISVLAGLGISRNSYIFNSSTSEYSVWYYLLNPQFGIQYLFNKRHSKIVPEEVQPYIRFIGGLQMGDNDSISHQESLFEATSWLTDKNLWYIQPEFGFKINDNDRSYYSWEISVVYRYGIGTVMWGELKGDGYQTNFNTSGNYFSISARWILPVNVNSTKKRKPKTPKVKPEKTEENKLHTVFTNRPTRTIKTIEINNPNIQLYVYDSGAKVDGDIVSMTLNGDYILEKYKLKKGRKLIDVHLQDGDNEITMHAHNEGKIPPNTAAIFIIDGNKKHHLVLNSDLKTSGILKLVYTK